MQDAFCTRVKAATELSDGVIAGRVYENAVTTRAIDKASVGNLNQPNGSITGGT